MGYPMPNVTVVGGGLAGCEAALQLADRGWAVELLEMRPLRSTAAHQTDLLGELVCSNSLKSNLTATAPGLLKAELELLGCRLLPIAKAHLVPAGSSLAVDRELFAAAVTRTVEDHPNIHLIRREATIIPDTPCILATGPLTSDALTTDLQRFTGGLYFFDAIAPIVSADSLNPDIVYARTRYDKGDPDFLNCPFDREQYLTFVEALRQARKHEAREFENECFRDVRFRFYENCVPIEELARRGDDTLRFGVMRPVGLHDPRTGKRPWAVLQLRSENSGLTAHNLVGCQTMLAYGEQARVFRLIPGLEHAEFLRFGSIHRNTYLDAPAVLNPDLSLKSHPGVFVAGVLCGVEGYVESIASGLLAARFLAGDLPEFPAESMVGSLLRALSEPVKDFSPRNANFGLLPPMAVRTKKDRKAAYGERALVALSEALKARCPSVTQHGAENSC
jgi:methylenetetrahydrofolate--tRNA-(uracil-5-)-methyltransferase